MPDYQKMYYLLFNKITDTINDLQVLQRECEEIYTNDENVRINLIRKKQNPPLINLLSSTFIDLIKKAENSLL